MTAIAWDGKTLAADKRSCYGGLVRVVTKIHRVNDVLVGGSGEMSFVNAMVDWVRNGRQLEQFPAHQRDKDDWQPVLVIEADGSTSFYERTAHPIRHECRYLAIGSGRDFASAAMHLGKSAKEAVAVACELSCDCGGGVDTLTLETE